MSSSSPSVPVILALSLVCVTSAAAQGAKPGPQGPVTAPPQIVTPPQALPDLVISKATATMKCNADGTRTATIVATVKNQSATGVADLSKVPWHIILEADWGTPAGTTPKSGSVKPQQGGPTVLKPGESWQSTLTITGIKPSTNRTPGSLAESYNLVVTADPLKAVTETDESNNQKILHIGLDKNCVQVVNN